MSRNTLLIHHFLCGCVSLWTYMTNLQHIVRTGDVWVSLNVERFQEVQNYSVALRQRYRVVTLAHRWIRVWVTRTGQKPRWWGEHLVVAGNCEETRSWNYIQMWPFERFHPVLTAGHLFILCMVIWRLINKCYRLAAAALWDTKSCVWKCCLIRRHFSLFSYQ